MLLSFSLRSCFNMDGDIKNVLLPSSQEGHCSIYGVAAIGVDWATQSLDFG